MSQLSPAALYDFAWRGAAVPVLLDVRPPTIYRESEITTVGAQKRSPEALERWAPLLLLGKAILVSYVRAGSIGRGLARSFESKAIPAKHLVAASKRSAKNNSQRGPSETLISWIAREQSKVDHD
jgi:hypothetical protein